MYVLLGVFGLFLTLGGSTQAPPPPPVLPSKWHAHVFVTDSQVWPLAEESLAVAAEGDFYYDYSSNITAYYLTQRYSSRIFQEINVYSLFSRYVYTIDDASGNCSYALVIEPGRYDFFSPTFLADDKYKYIGIEYYYVESQKTLVLTQHWQNLNNPLVPINYWHQVETNSPFRLMWGSVNPVIVEFRSVVGSFSDIPNPAYYTRLPEQCSSATQTVAQPQHIARTATSPENSAPTVGTAWPQQWHGKAMFTGNNFGFQQKKWRPKIPTDIGNPTLIPISLSGHFYYDYVGLRECNEWVDEVSHVRTKTLIVGGKFHIVTLPTNSCMIVPVYPVGGPLKPNWPTNLPYIDQQYNLVQGSFQRMDHFRLDALDIGVDHSFNYWETDDNHTPLQFQGPVLEVYPYGQSAMVWGETVLGLEGVDLDTIFSVPAICPLLDVDFEQLPVQARVHLSMALLAQKVK